MIWSLISGFVTSNLEWVIGGVAFIAALFAGRRSGRQAERHKLTKMRLEASEEARKIEREVRGEGDEDLIDLVTGRS